MAHSSESQLDGVKSTQEPQLDLSTNEQNTSRDQPDLSPVTGAILSAENHVVPPEVDQPTPRIAMNQTWRSEQRSSELPDTMLVKCGDLDGELHAKRLGSGSRGPCILCTSTGVWLTPNQFECQGGQGYFRYWKRSIRHGSKPLECYIKKGLIKLHSRFCDCHRCSAPISDAPQRLRLNKVWASGGNCKRPDAVVLWAGSRSHPCCVITISCLSSVLLQYCLLRVRDGGGRETRRSWLNVRRTIDRKRAALILRVRWRATTRVRDLGEKMTRGVDLLVMDQLE